MIENQGYTLPGGGKIYRVDTTTKRRLLSEHSDQFGEGLLPSAPTTGTPAKHAAADVQSLMRRMAELEAELVTARKTPGSAAKLSKQVAKLGGEMKRMSPAAKRSLSAQ